MKIKLTLQEKLRDLREERKLTLAEVSEQTGIPLSTLGHLEKDEDMRVGYQDVAALAKFYSVSADYLFGLTDNRLHRNVAIDDISLSDGAITVLKNKKTNNRLISELLAHSDFPQLLSSIEVYIDRKVLPQMNTMNVMYKMAETAIKENYAVTDNDEIIKFLQQAVVNEDEYLRYRISERFNAVMKSLFDSHKKDALPVEQTELLNEIKEGFKTYLSAKESPDRAKLLLLGKQLGLNLSELSQDEVDVLIKALQRSDKFKKTRRK